MQKYTLRTHLLGLQFPLCDPKSRVNIALSVSYSMEGVGTSNNVQAQCTCWEKLYNDLN